MTEQEFKTGKKDKAEKPAEKPAAKEPVIALKDHVLFAPPRIAEPITIKAGEDLSKVLDKIPGEFQDALVTEGVILKGK